MRAKSDGMKELAVVIKADVQGSIEAICSSLFKLPSDEIKLRILHQAVGGITESDISLAKATGAIVLGFNVRASSAAATAADKEKVISNVQEVKARGALTIGIVREGSNDTKDIFDHTIEIPNVPDEWMPILSVIPLQLLAYHTAILRGADVDKPRNLAKSVTVE
jgi:translation initiation factor IF-2